jgi:cysteine-rich repeat protein
MTRSIFALFSAALFCACNLGPKICESSDPDYLCDTEDGKNVLVFCQLGLPEVRLDCNGFPEERTCNDEFQECVKNPVCGNGTLEANEECDDENIESGDGCSNNCDLETICGDGIEEQGETCDDGNIIAGDGCNATCQIETRQINCDPLDPLNANDFDVPNGFVLQLAGQCTSEAVILEPNLVIEPIPGQTVSFINETNLIIGDADVDTPPVTVVFRNIDFTATTREKVFTVFGNSSLAIVNSIMSNANPEPGSRLVNCFGTSKVLLDRVTANRLKNDVGFKAEDSCQMLISNSVISNSAPECKKPIELKDDATAEILLSTFFENRPSESGIAKVATGTLIMNGVLSNQEEKANGDPIPPFDSTSQVSGAGNMIEGANFTDNTNEDPLLLSGSLLPSNPNALNVIALPFATLFDPSVVFDIGVDIDIFAFDRDGNARNSPTDIGAFETP